MKLAIILLLITITVCCGAQQPEVQSKPAALSPAPIPALEQRAETGDAQAQFELGRAYEDGKADAQDDARAVEWFRKSAEQGNAQAQNSLGVMYALGRGISRDREEAMRWYKKAAKLGLPEAIYNVAISYYNGEGAEENMGLACTWMTVAQQKGDAQAAEALKHIQQEVRGPLDRCKMDLAALYEKGEEIPQDAPAAAAIYKEIAERNSKESIFVGTAMYKLCQLYVAGKGVPQDYAQAKAWCKKSRVPFAYVVMARMAERGLGQEKNPREALEYYRDAALVGVPDGYMELGRLQMESGSHDALKNAYFWYGVAAKLKFAGADEKLKEIAAKLSEKEVAEVSRQVTDWSKLPLSKRDAELRKH